MSEPIEVLSDISPYGLVQAVVEQDDRVIYFYLFGAEHTDFGMRSCWVRNLLPAPEALDVEGMQQGQPPMMPRASCSHPDGAPALVAEDLQIVWFEEGDAAALLDGQGLLAVIPGWSGHEGFTGYARDCLDVSHMAWPLGTPEENAIFGRVRGNQQFWADWSQEDSPWGAIQDAFVDAYTGQLGAYANYYAIDGGAWPPKAMLRFVSDAATAFVTLGVSLRAQPWTDPNENAPERPRRIELGIALSGNLPDATVEALAGYVSGQTLLPWHHFTFLGEHHTMPCDTLQSLDPDSPFTAVLLAQDFGGSPRLHVPTVRDERVHLLWMIPITEEERLFAMDEGSPALVERLEAAGRTWLFG